MCDACAQSDRTVRRNGRRKLWEIASQWHCVIIGTCAAMPELRSLAAKFGIVFKQAPATDYEVHSTMVYMASNDRRVGKAMHKLLDRKYALAVTRFNRLADSPAVAAAWRDAIETGEVAGALWGAMTHGAISCELEARIFGEVHMLSHQSGASSRADLRRIYTLEREKTELEAKVARQQDRLRDEISGRDAALRDLREQIEAERSEVRRLSHAASGAAEMEGLKTLVTELQRHLDIEAEDRRLADRGLRAMQARLTDAEQAKTRLEEETQDLREEIAALESRVLMAMGAPCRGEDGDGLCPRPDLHGRCILYVGGRVNHVPHLRRIVEDCNGVFVHHDGGAQENIGRLDGLMGQADAVMFPVDCVSHMAHDRLKRLCKRWSKPFVPVRRSGLGAFMRALESVGSDGPVL